MKKLIVVSTLVIFACLLNSCGTLFGNNDRVVHVSSAPSNANVYLNGTLIGQTPSGGAPLNIYLPQQAGFGGNTFIQVQKPGYEAITQPVQTTFQPVAILDILFWPAFIVDIMTGNIVRISNPYMNFALPAQS